MRSSKSRSRSKANRNRSSLGNVVNRVFDSSGPEGKVRGTPQQIIDKYNQLARDAQLANDRVAAENFQQHAEHYLRMLSEAQKEADARREQQERENRERQMQRDRDRAQRQERESTGDNAVDDSAHAASQPGSDDTPTQQPKTSAEVIDLSEGDDNASGLVETPENPANEARTKKPRAPRKPRKKPVESKTDPDTKTEAPNDAAE